MHRIDEFDRIVFLGDYVDTWKNKWSAQISNLFNIVRFKKDNPEKVNLCWGNHDTSYYLNEQCSGYQPEHAVDLKDFFEKHKDYFEVVYEYDNWVFAHGGVSEKWMKCAGIEAVSEINQLFKERPNFFKWVGPDEFGDNENEGPLWIRPRSLINHCIKKYNFCVGHTESNEPRIIHKNKQLFVFTDTQEHDTITIIDTKNNKVNFEKLIF